MRLVRESEREGGGESEREGGGREREGERKGEGGERKRERQKEGKRIQYCLLFYCCLVE